MTDVVVVGLGDIGIEIARSAFLHPSLDVVGAVDIGSDKVGIPLAALTGVDGAGDVRVSDDLDATLIAARPEVILLSTSSRFIAVALDIATCFGSGASVVTTCEEMSCPWGRVGLDELERRAEQTGRAVLGVGVNPGFVMDLLPSLLSTASTLIERVRIERRVDLTRRRPALREKAGVGLAVSEFTRRAALGEIGHVGLDASARLVAAALGLDVDLPAVEIEPMVTGEGEVIGFRQWTGWPAADRSPAIELHLEMSAWLDAEFDRIEIVGEPSFEAVIEGGIAGDVATAALVINAVPLVLAATPGVKTVLDLPPLRAWLPRA
jgi:2,4-diaminopentanoate dehydrogenase